MKTRSSPSSASHALLLHETYASPQPLSIAAISDSVLLCANAAPAVVATSAMTIRIFFISPSLWLDSDIAPLGRRPFDLHAEEAGRIIVLEDRGAQHPVDVGLHLAVLGDDLDVVPVERLHSLRLRGVVVGVFPLAAAQEEDVGHVAHAPLD